MKNLRPSKFSIFIISILVLAFVVYGVLVYNSSKNNTTQEERIYLHTDILDRYGPETFVKVSDMKPNDVGFFLCIHLPTIILILQMHTKDSC
ncbi:MAG: hypothetical protein ABI340_07995 [Nitrososphaera sp.]|jgi:hypothetical protein